MRKSVLNAKRPFKISSCSLLYITKIGITSIIWLNLSEIGVTIEPPPQMAQASMQSENQVAQKMLFVNPSVGSNGDGSKSTPFKTITQALQVAEPNSVIILATGKYSVESGETFPLQLKSGVSIQGDPLTKGSNIAIAGGGTFISPTFARQDVTILGANSSSLTGVTVTNPNPRGYGLWIESSSPTVSDNTFTGSDHDGISITGNSSAIIRHNHFHHNGANGITIYGTSKPQVRENVFEQTGFGINIAQKAAPLVIGNQIIKNRSGVVAQANSQPVLRNNVIEGNTEDGVVAIANSLPDLGTKTQPGGNIFRQNARSDINSSAAKQLLSAVGNQLTQNHFIGNIDLAGTKSSIIGARGERRGVRREGLEAKGERLEARGEGRETRNEQKSPPSTPLKSPLKGGTTAEPPHPPLSPLEGGKQLSPLLSGEDGRGGKGAGGLGTGVPPLAAIEIPVPPPESTGQSKPNYDLLPQKSKSVNVNDNNNRTDIAPTASSNTEIEIPPPPPAPKPVAPPPPPKTDSLTQGLPVLAPAPINASELLPVPKANIPIGNISQPPRQQEVATPVATAGTPQVATTNLRYRVVVEAETETQQEKVRSLVPDAFRTVSNGKAVMQVGAFSDRAQALEVLQLLNSSGLKAALKQLN